MKLLQLFSLFFLLCNTYIQTIQIQSIYSSMQQNSAIQEYQCHSSESFYYPELPIAQYKEHHPNSGVFESTKVFIIPHGRAISQFGCIIINNHFVLELLPQNYPIDLYSSLLDPLKIENRIPKKINGKVLVLTRTDYNCYGHWLVDVLTRLELVNMHNIKYDWIYVPYDKQFIKDTLKLLNINESKILDPFANYYIEADELIVPSLVTRRPATQQNPYPHAPGTMYSRKWSLDWLQNKFIPLSNTINETFSDKVFISRNDCNQRRMINEDEIFSYFEQKGFKRYYLAKMSFLEQVKLFHQAKYIVAAHGSGLTNLIFCSPNTEVIEIFQNQFDSTFWQLSYLLGLKHHCIQTQEYKPGNWKVDTTIPLFTITSYLEKHIPYL